MREDDFLREWLLKFLPATILLESGNTVTSTKLVFTRKDGRPTESI